MNENNNTGRFFLLSSGFIFRGSQEEAVESEREQD